MYRLLWVLQVISKTYPALCRLAYDYNNLHFQVKMYLGENVWERGGEEICHAVKVVPRGFHVSEQKRSVCLDTVFFFSTWFMCSHKYRSRIVLLMLCHVAPVRFYQGQRGSWYEVTSSWVGLGVRKRNEERLMTSLKWILFFFSCPYPNR